MYKILISLFSLLFISNALAGACIVNVSISKPFQSPYNVVVNIVDAKYGVALPILKGVSSSGGSNKIQYTANCPRLGGGLIKLKASYALTGKQAEFVTTRAPAYFTGDIIPGATISVIFPNDFQNAPARPLPTMKK